MEAQRVAGLPRVKRKGLRGRFLWGRFIVLLIFRSGLLGAVQLQDRSDPNFPDALLRVRLPIDDGVLPLRARDLATFLVLLASLSGK
jgi:hypothetical protein